MDNSTPDTAAPALSGKPAKGSLKALGYRFMLSPDGQTGDWVHEDEVTARCPTYVDCTDMPDEEFQRFVAERQAVRPYIVGMVV